MVERFVRIDLKKQWKGWAEENRIRWSVRLSEKVVDLLDEFVLTSYKLVKGPHGIYVNCFYGNLNGEKLRIKKEHSFSNSDQYIYMTEKICYDTYSAWSGDKTSSTLTKKELEQFYEILCSFEKDELGMIKYYLAK